MEISKLSLDEIRNIINTAGIAEKRKMVEMLKKDDRKSMAAIIKRLENDLNSFDNEMKRLTDLKKYEYFYYSKGAKYIAGIDEVGRGPLAGPVYACAVILPLECMIEGINDSKKVSKDKRDILSKQIKDNALCYGIGCCDQKVIDEVNILNATYMAMREAIEKLSIKPQVLLIDAVKIPGVEDIFQVPIIKGDSLSFSIASASIIAKVERDRVMDEYHEKYPEYNFKENKGYGTKEHIEAIKRYGPCPIHRKTFIRNIV